MSSIWRLLLVAHAETYHALRVTTINCGRTFVSFPTSPFAGVEKNNASTQPRWSRALAHSRRKSEKLTLQNQYPLVFPHPGHLPGSCSLQSCDDNLHQYHIHMKENVEHICPLHRHQEHCPYPAQGVAECNWSGLLGVSALQWSQEDWSSLESRCPSLQQPCPADPHSSGYWAPTRPRSGRKC